MCVCLYACVLGFKGREEASGIWLLSSLCCISQKTSCLSPSCTSVSFALFGLVGFDSLAYRQISSVERRRQVEELVTLRWGAEVVAEGREDPEHAWTSSLAMEEGGPLPLVLGFPSCCKSYLLWCCETSIFVRQS